MIARGLALFVRRLVLLVDDDQPEVAHRREDGRARADDNIVKARSNLPPFVVALARRQAAVHDGDRIAESGAKPGDRLRRERDLGDKHYRPLAPPDNGVDRLQVHLGFPAAGDALEQYRLELAPVDALPDEIERDLLLARQLVLGPGVFLDVVVRIAAEHLFLEKLDKFLLDQSMDRVVGATGDARQFPRQHFAAIGQDFQNGRLPGRRAAQFVYRRLDVDARRDLHGAQPLRPGAGGDDRLAHDQPPLLQRRDRAVKAVDPDLPLELRQSHSTLFKEDFQYLVLPGRGTAQAGERLVHVRVRERRGRDLRFRGQPHARRQRAI